MLVNMSPKLLLGIVGTIGLLFFWFMFRSCIKEGTIKTEIPFIFLLSNEYKDRRSD